MLPKIPLPTYNIELPASKKSIKIRPYTVAEEKLLLIAMESAKGAKSEKDYQDVVDAYKNLIQACLSPNSDNIKLEELPSIDIEYIFLQLRIKSVGEIVELNLRHNDGVNAIGEKCDHVTPYQLDLSTVEVEFDPEHKKEIDIGNDLIIVMKYPTVNTLNNLRGSSEIENFHEVIAYCVDYLYDKEQIYNDFTKTEIRDFISNLTKQNLEKLVTFFQTQPKLTKTIKYTCSKCKQEETVKFEGFFDFFT